MKRPSRADNTITNKNNKNNNELEEEDDDAQPPPPLLALLAWCQQEPTTTILSSVETQLQAQPPPFVTASNSLLIASVSDWVYRLWSEQSHRHLAWTSTFPMVHYITLTFLAVGISIAFLVATDQSTSIFLEGLPVRILWGILMGSFTALAVVCYDLSAPFGGAYQVTTATTYCHHLPVDLKHDESVQSPITNCTYPKTRQPLLRNKASTLMVSI